jgi:hypothetical protein
VFFSNSPVSHSKARRRACRAVGDLGGNDVFQYRPVAANSSLASSRSTSCALVGTSVGDELGDVGRQRQMPGDVEVDAADEYPSPPSPPEMPAAFNSAASNASISAG